MARINPIDIATATPEQKQLLASVKQALGMIPNLVATMAQSPAVAKAYLAFDRELSKGVLARQTREQVILAVSQTNECEYCLAAHSALGAKAGLSAAQIQGARQGTGSDEKTASALTFAVKVVEERGKIADQDVEELRRAGWSETEISEIIGTIALSLFTNYFNHIAGTEVDFPATLKFATSAGGSLSPATSR